MEFLGLATLLMLATGLIISRWQLREANRELKAAKLLSERLQSEVGYLSDTPAGQIAASRIPNQDQLTYRFRVRVPTSKFRVAYSTLWRKQSGGPTWFSAVAVPQGDSILTIRILEDERDQRWKIAAIVETPRETKRMATSLPADQVEIFRGSHQVIRAGIGRETTSVLPGQSIRLLDERWLVGEGGLLLYGDRTPEQDQVGIYAELQPDLGPL
jgi:hypothetical protein